jgi:hypothetical protein
MEYRERKKYRKIENETNRHVKKLRKTENKKGKEKETHMSSYIVVFLTMTQYRRAIFFSKP